MIITGTPCNMSSPPSSSSSSSITPFSTTTTTTNNIIAYLPPPPPRPWTSTARVCLYKHTPPSYLLYPNLEDALIKKRPGRPCVGNPNKRQAVMMVVTSPPFSSGSDATAESGVSSILNPARLNRMLSNRISARRSRMRKQEYLDSLKKSIIVEEDKIAELSPKVKENECVNIILRNENVKLKQSVVNLERIKAAREAEYVAMKKQIHDLVSYLKIAATLHSRV